MQTMSNSRCTFVKRAVTGVRAVVVTFLLAGVPALGAGEEIERRYQGFTLWIDCERKAAIRFYYHLGRDVGSVKRDYAYYDDPEFDQTCQQTSTESYNENSNIEDHDRGHLVPFNHMDDSLIASHQTNYMTNILPQAKSMNQGAWKHTEEITECFREFDDLDIYGGPIWGSNDVRLEEHSVDVPEAFWKVIIRSDDTIAWRIPNKNMESVGFKHLNEYLVSIDEIEQDIDYVIPINEKWKTKVPEKSWDVRVCDDKGLHGWRG